MSNVHTYRTTLVSGCGVGYLYGYGPQPRGYDYVPNIDVPVNHGGVGIHCACFVGTKVCQEVYENQHKKYKIVYQSPSRRNSNSGRNFIFVVYDRKAPVTEDMNKDYKFPFRPRS